MSNSAPVPFSLEDLQRDLRLRRKRLVPVEQRCIEKYIGGAVTLPPMPRIASVLIPMLGKNDSPIADCVDLIETDQALATALLRCSNSAAYFRGQLVTNVRDAVMRIGIKEASRLALGLSTRAMFDLRVQQALEFVDADWEEEWRASVTVAFAARDLSQHLHRGNPEHAYTAGLLQNVGYSLAAYLLAHEAVDDPAVEALDIRTRRAAAQRMRAVLMGEYLLREDLPPELSRLCLELDESLGKTEAEPASGATDPTVAIIRLTLGLYAMTSAQEVRPPPDPERTLSAAQLLGLKRGELEDVKRILGAARESVAGLEQTFVD